MREFISSPQGPCKEPEAARQGAAVPGYNLVPQSTCNATTLRRILHPFRFVEGRTGVRTGRGDAAWPAGVRSGQRWSK